MRVTMDRYEADWAMVRARLATCTCWARGGASIVSAVDAMRDLLRKEQPITGRPVPARAFVVVETTAAGRARSRTATRVVFFNFRGDRAIEISQAFE